MADNILPESVKFHPLCELFPRITGDEYVRFKQDIRENGLRVPIVQFKGEVIDGRNRFYACQEVGVAPRFEEWDGNPEDLATYVISLNLSRRHLTESQRGMVAAMLADMRVGDTAANLRNADSANLQSRGSKTSRAQAASLLNVSERTVNTAKKIQREAAPEITEAVKQGRLSLNAASKAIQLEGEKQIAIAAAGNQVDAKKLLDRSLREERVKSQNRLAKSLSDDGGQALPSKKYGLIYADPPWRYEHSVSKSRDIENQYPTMSLEEICAIPALDFSQENAVLFLWATSPKLRESFAVLDAWGFDYRTCAVWDKQKIGMGY